MCTESRYIHLISWTLQSGSEQCGYVKTTPTGHDTCVWYSTPRHALYLRKASTLSNSSSVLPYHEEFLKDIPLQF
jgi:hypothetical protein